MDILPIYQAKTKCMFCEHPFSTSKVRSRFVRVMGHDSDFKPIYKNAEAVNPMYYNVAVCPSCGFAFTEDFLPFFAPHIRERIASTIQANWKHRSFGDERSVEEAIETYKLALLSARLKEEKNLPIAGLALRLAWIYRDLKDEANEHRFLEVARDAYTDAYSTDEQKGTMMSEIRVIYLIGELSYRIGDRDAAVRNFSRVIESQKNSTDPQVVELAKERWREIRENEA